MLPGLNALPNTGRLVKYLDWRSVHTSVVVFVASRFPLLNELQYLVFAARCGARLASALWGESSSAVGAKDESPCLFCAAR
jgi:hypothetical protein